MRPMANDNQGRPLPPNLYQRRSDGAYRYKNAAGKFRTVKNQSGAAADYSQAILITERANSLRGKTTPSIKTIQFWVDKYTAWAEEHNPALATKRAWRDRKNELNRFAADFAHININRLELNDLRGWWDGLTYDQQHNRRSAFSKLFQWCISSGSCSINPFSTSDNSPRLFQKMKPAKQRGALEMADFWTIYHSEHAKKYPHVKIAMGISLTTGMREEDICLLRFDTHIIDNRLCTSIGKSVSQRGAMAASHHGYDLTTHAMLRGLIKEARELSLKHRRCPFILSYHQRGHAEQAGAKQHISQVRPKKLSHDFSRVRDLCSIPAQPGKNPATFHEVRGLFVKTGLQHYAPAQIQQAAAHVSLSTTLAYPAGHKPDYRDIAVVITPAMIGGEL